MDGFIFVLIAMLAIMYLLLIRPQRQQQKRHRVLLESLKVGDEVVTSGGIYGEVKRLDTERVALEVDEDVEIVVARRAITSIVPPDEPEEPEEPEEPRPAEARWGAFPEDTTRR